MTNVSHVIAHGVRYALKHIGALALGLTLFLLLASLFARYPQRPGYFLWDAFPVDHHHAWVSGGAGVFYTDDAGEHWKRVLPQLRFDFAASFPHIAKDGEILPA